MIRTADKRYYKRRGTTVFEDVKQRTSLIGENICQHGWH